MVRVYGRRFGGTKAFQIFPRDHLLGTNYETEEQIYHRVNNALCIGYMLIVVGPRTDPCGENKYYVKKELLEKDHERNETDKS